MSLKISAIRRAAFPCSRKSFRNTSFGMKLAWIGSSASAVTSYVFPDMVPGRPTTSRIGNAQDQRLSVRRVCGELHASVADDKCPTRLLAFDEQDRTLGICCGGRNCVATVKRSRGRKTLLRIWRCKMQKGERDLLKVLKAEREVVN